MKRTTMYSVGGQTFNVAADEEQMFNEAAKASGVTVSPMRRFRVNGRTIDIDNRDVGAFSAAAKQTGFAPEEVRTMQMADGSQREFTNKEMAKYLRSPEYRESADYVKPEQGSVTWAGIKGALSGAVEGAVEGGKAGLAKAAWALPQVGTGVLRAGGNLVNALGNAPNAVGNAMVRGANAADAKMEEIMPTSTADRLGYEDWGTKTGDFFGGAARMAVEFAPAGPLKGASLLQKLFRESMFASNGINAYENALRTAEENGIDIVSANALGATAGLVSYISGKALLKAGGVGDKIANPLLRELTKAATSGAVMGAQGGANKAIENAATGKPIGEGVAGAAAEGFAEGAAFHGANMIPRLPLLVKQTKEHYTAARTWIMDAAKDDPAMLSDLMDQPALDDVIKARRGGKDVSRKMGDDIFLPNNMSGEQRNAVVDSIIAYRDGIKAQGEASKASIETAQAEKERIGTQNYKDAVGRKEAEQNAQIRRDAMNGVEELIPEQPTTRNEGRGENADMLQMSADQYAKDDPAGSKAYGEWLKRNGKKDSIANRRDWFENDYTKAGEHPLTARATENEIPDITRDEYDKAVADWTAKKEAAQKQGKTLDEPKPYAQFEDYDALLTAQKSKMDAADKAAADAAHAERGEDIAQAFADWKEDAVKAQKQGKVSPKAPAEVEDVRAKAEADAVVQRLNAEWQKAKTPAERNAIKGQLVDRLKELGIGAKDRSAEAQPSKTDTAQSKTDDEVAKVERPTTPKAAKSEEPVKNAKTSTEGQARTEGALRKPIDTTKFKVVQNDKTGKYEVVDADGNVQTGYDNGLKVKLSSKSKSIASKLLDSFVEQYDTLNKSLEGVREIVPGESAKRLKAEEKAAKAKFKTEREAILADIDTTMKNVLNGAENKGVIEEYLKNIADAKAKGDNKLAKMFDNSLVHELDKVRFGKNGIVIKVPESNATYTVYTAKGLEALRRAVTKEYGKEAGKRYYEIAEADRLESLRSDNSVKAWAKSNNRAVVDGKVSPGAVNDYLKAQVGKAVNATKRLFSDAKVEVVDRDWNAEIDGESNTLRAKDGRIVGTFDPATKDVKLFRGADEKTVYHELGGHGVMDWAERNSKPLYNKLIDAARTAPKEYWDDVRSNYAGADETTMVKEIIARIAEGKGAEFIKLKDAPKTWYAKAYTAVRDALIGFLEMCHGNSIDLDKLNDMTPDEAVNYLFKQIAKGKTLGKLGAADAEGAMGAGEKWANKFWNRHASLEKIDKKSADEKALQPGREAEFQVRKFNVKKDEFKELLRKGDISVNEVDEYMKAVAAEERNAADGFASSGMSDAQIKATREFFAKHPNIKEIERAADYLWKMQEEGMRERIRSGLVSESEYSEWNAREKHHVPFRSAIDENGEWVNQYGRGVSGPEFVQHEGRYSESGSPSTWMFEEYANAHLRAIENDTRKVLADAVRNNAALGSIETNPALKESKINGDGGDRNVVSFKTVNEDGKSVTHHIVLKGERGAAAASSYTNRNLANKNQLLRKTQAFMRFWASTATEWSPTFALRNTFADNVDAAMVVLAEKGFKEGGKWLKSYAKNRAAVSKEVWKFARTGKVEDGSLLAQYMKEGGLIGGFQREGYGDIQRQFSADTIAKEFKNGGNRAKAVANGVFGLVKAVNSYAELMTRVAAFKTNTEQGMSGKDAALWSRRISMDFNQKGDITPITNTLFMFSNSTIGATMRQLQAANTALKTQQGKRALLGLAAFGMAEAMLEHAMNADEDKERAKRGEATGADVNEHTRKTSLYVRVGGNVFRAPTHEDPLMKLVYVANATTRLLLGDMKAKDYAFEVGGGALEDVPRFFGQGSKTLEAGFNTWLPTALQPIMQGVENKDYAGRPIYRPKYNEALPDSSNGRKSTQSEYKWMAETLNELTGGNKGRKGALDFAPETLKLIGESLGKNLGKDLGNAADVGLNILTGNFGELDSRRTPIVRDVMRKTEGNDNRYFSAMRKFDADKLDLATRDKALNWDDGERKAYYEAHPWLRKNGGKSTKIERIVNGYTQNGVHISGINDLRRMEGGERRVMTAQGMKWRSYDWSQEKIAEFKKMRLEKQAKVLELMGE